MIRFRAFLKRLTITDILWCCALPYVGYNIYADHRDTGACEQACDKVPAACYAEDPRNTKRVCDTAWTVCRQGCHQRNPPQQRSTPDDR